MNNTTNEKEETKKSFWDCVKLILAGVVGGILLLLGIQKKKADKTVVKNEKTIDDIKDCEQDIEKISDNINDVIEDNNTTIKKSDKVISSCEDLHKKSEVVASTNKKLLEKYKK